LTWEEFMKLARWPGLLALLLLAPAAWTFDDAKDKPKPADKPGTPAEQFQALTKEWDTTLADLQKQFRAAKTDEEKQKIREKGQELMKKLPERAIDLAEKNAKDPVAIDALTWVLTRVRSEEMMDRVLETLGKDHLESPHLGKACEQLAEMPWPAVEKFLRAAVAKSKNKGVQGLATFGLAKHLQSRAEEEGDAAKADQLNKEAEKLFEAVMAKYADVNGSEGPIGKSAKTALSLAVGRETPDIEGQDADSKKFKLSDYRGKVVLLDFWGHW
jgi:hypothetical protein